MHTAHLSPSRLPPTMVFSRDKDPDSADTITWAARFAALPLATFLEKHAGLDPAAILADPPGHLLFGADGHGTVVCITDVAGFFADWREGAEYVHAGYCLDGFPDGRPGYRTEINRRLTHDLGQPLGLPVITFSDDGTVGTLGATPWSIACLRYVETLGLARLSLVVASEPERMAERFGRCTTGLVGHHESPQARQLLADNVDLFVQLLRHEQTRLVVGPLIHSGYRPKVAERGWYWGGERYRTASVFQLAFDDLPLAALLIRIHRLCCDVTMAAGRAGTVHPDNFHCYTGLGNRRQ